jgi:hypothetical protein
MMKKMRMRMTDKMTTPATGVTVTEPSKAYDQWCCAGSPAAPVKK